MMHAPLIVSGTRRLLKHKTYQGQLLVYLIAGMISNPSSINKHNSSSKPRGNLGSKPLRKARALSSRSAW